MLQKVRTEEIVEMLVEFSAVDNNSKFGEVQSKSVEIVRGGEYPSY